MTGFAAACQLRQRAAENGFFVECVCLSASIIDGMLRIGLILKHQLDIGSRDIPLELIIQREGERGLSERQIYLRAAEEGVIPQFLLERLQEAYDQRNRVIHQYIISRITTSELLDAGITYERLISDVSKYVEILESEQIRQGAGMTVTGPRPTIGYICEIARGKHGSEVLADILISRPKGDATQS